jgi:hypothetical protein
VAALSELPSREAVGQKIRTLPPGVAMRAHVWPFEFGRCPLTNKTMEVDAASDRPREAASKLFAVFAWLRNALASRRRRIRVPAAELA